MKIENNYSWHHKLPRSQGGSDDEDNVELIKNSKHRAIHTLHQNQMIAMQLIQTISISKSALRPDVVNRLLDTLTSKDIGNPYERYKTKCIK